MKFIVGLGNPGERYMGTRHNLGFETVEEFRRKLNLGEWEVQEKFKSETVRVSDDLILVRPQTYMNNSGMAVAKLVNFYKSEMQNVVVIHDELDLLLGKIKVRLGGGFGGHHGVESIIKSLGSEDFVRVRLGVGTEQGFLGEHKRAAFDANKFVMEPFLSGEASKVRTMLKRAVKVLETIISEGFEKAQNQFN